MEVRTGRKRLRLNKTNLDLEPDQTPQLLLSLGTESLSNLKVH